MPIMEVKPKVLLLPTAFQSRAKQDPFCKKESVTKDEMVRDPGEKRKQHNIENSKGASIAKTFSSSKFVIPKKTAKSSDVESKTRPKEKNHFKETKKLQTKKDEREKKPLRCPSCPQSFNLSANLRRHLVLRGHSKDMYKCDECDKSFLRNYQLVHHKKSHSDERPYVCPECEIPFKTSCTLSVHLRTHTGEKPFACEECSARFRHKYSLNTHLMIHTGEKPFICALCDKRFRCKRHLAYHMPSHTNLKPKVCGECGSRFRDNSRLKTHMRRHTGETTFTCDVCWRKFEIELNYKKHMLTHT